MRLCPLQKWNNLTSKDTSAQILEADAYNIKNMWFRFKREACQKRAVINQRDATFIQ